MSFITNFLAKRLPKNPAAEMAFLDHVEELRWHIVRSLAAIILCAIFVFIKIDFIFDKIIMGPAHIDFIAYRWFCALGKLMHVDALCMDAINVQFQNTELSGQFMMSFSASFMIGFIVAFPYVFWELWRFIKPALSSMELKYARGIVFWATLLFFIGIGFSYFIIAPFTISFFANYTLSPQFHNIITINNYFSTMSDLVFGMGLVFELPIIVYFLSKIGIVTPAFLRDKRRFALLILFVLATVITPPDWLSCWLVFIPLWALYEAAIVISARMERDRKKKELEKPLDW